jgi:Concanavalin A-like lectin/glucanases superfamily
MSDVSGHGANGVLSAGASIVADHGGAVAINGSGAVSSVAPRIRTDRSFTVSAWVRAEPGVGTMAALGQLGGFATACSLRYETAAGAWSFAMAAADDPSAAQDEAVSSIPSPLGTWTSVTGVYDSVAGTLAIYIDGQAAGTARHVNAWPAAGPFVVGRDQANGNPADQLTGAVGSVVAYDYALDAQEILLAYKSGNE